MNKSESIEGTVFQCQCRRRFIAGPAGLDKLDVRVMAHMKKTGHQRCWPVNPKPGMVFVLNRDKDFVVHAPYKEGEDVAKWNNDVQQAAREAGDFVRPAEALILK